MKPAIVLLVFSLIASVLMNSCTIQKRVHRKGWHVEWNHRYKKAGGQEDVTTYSNEKKEIATTEIPQAEERSTAETEVEVMETSVFDAPSDSPENSQQAIEEKTHDTKQTISHSSTSAKIPLKTMNHLKRDKNSNTAYIVALLFFWIALLVVIAYVFLTLTMTSLTFLEGFYLLIGGALAVIVIIIILTVISLSFADYKRSINLPYTPLPKNTSVETISKDDPAADISKKESAPMTKANKIFLGIFLSMILALFILIGTVK